MGRKVRGVGVLIFFDHVPLHSLLFTQYSTVIADTDTG